MDDIYARAAAELENTRQQLARKIVDLAGKPVDPARASALDEGAKKTILGHLAGLDPVAYALEADAAAKALGMHPSRIDAAVSAARTHGSIPEIHSLDGAALYAAEHPPVAWSVKQILPEGVTLLVGKPKVRKSWLALTIAVSVAMGKPVLGHTTKSGDALYLALEDTERRLTQRMRMITPDAAPLPGRLTLATDWPRIGQGGVEAIDAWAESHPEPTLVVIDTLARLRPAIGKHEGAYEADYASCRPLIDLCKRRKLSILIVHHARKAVADDPTDAASGTLGLTGGVDGFMVLTKAQGQRDSAILHVNGRDIDESRDIPLVWNQEITQWEISGDPVELFHLCEYHRQVHGLLSGRAMHADEILDSLGIPKEARQNSAVRKKITRCLAKLADLDLIDQTRFDRRWQTRSK